MEDHDTRFRTLTGLQWHTLDKAIAALQVDLLFLRRRFGYAVTVGEFVGHLLTNPERHGISTVPEIRIDIARLHGFAVGLGFNSAIEVFRLYEAGELLGGPGDAPSVAALLVAAEAVLEALGPPGTGPPEQAMSALRRAIEPFRAKTWP